MEGVDRVDLVDGVDRSTCNLQPVTCNLGVS